MPGALVALALARPMQRQHIRAQQNADTQAAKPLDALPQRGMLALGGIQARGAPPPAGPASVSFTIDRYGHLLARQGGREPGPSCGRQDGGAAPCSQPTSIRRHREESP
jgi:hypothetical protein